MRFIFIILLFTVSSCTLTKKVNDGFSAYERKQYSVAVDYFIDDYDQSNDNGEKGELAYYLAKSFHYLNDDEKTLYWYKKAVEHEYSLEAVRELANAYKKVGKYKQSLTTYEKLNDALGNDPNVKREVFILKDLIAQSSDSDKIVEVALGKMSSGYADYAPTFFGKDYIVFTSDRTEVTGSELYKWTGNSFSDLFIVPKGGGQARPFDAAINSQHNEGTAVFNQSLNEIIFTRCQSEGQEDDFCKLYTSYFEDGSWTDPMPLSFQIDGINFGQPALIENDSVLIFTAEMESGVGGKDLYYSERLMAPDSSTYWSEPYLMPKTINTMGNEGFPTTQGDTLYFSSDFHPGYGGYDIFMTYLKDGSWSSPQNLREPINSSSDDYGYIVDTSFDRPGLVKGYLSSSREGLGNDDIYAFTIRQKMVDDTPVNEPDNEIIEELDIAYYVVVKVVDKDTEQPLRNTRIKISKEEKEKYLTTDDKGMIIEELSNTGLYDVWASKRGYFNERENLMIDRKDVKEGALSHTYNLTIPLSPIRINEEIVLDDIYYDYDQWKIRDDAKPTLDSLATLLKLNPRITIELASHTDCRGELDYNLILSQKRAQSAVDYIAQNGVNPRRMIAKGYGENVLRNTCVCESCTEEQHQENRRTTFKITSE